MKCAYFCVSWRDIEVRIIAHVFIYEKIIKTWSSRRAVTGSVSSALAKLGLWPEDTVTRRLCTPRRITSERSRCPNQNDHDSIACTRPGMRLGRSTKIS